MTEEQVEAFVARYMPAYELFSEGILRGDKKSTPRWASQLLQLTIDRQRQVIRIDRTRPTDSLADEDASQTTIDA